MRDAKWLLAFLVLLVLLSFVALALLSCGESGTTTTVAQTTTSVTSPAPTASTTASTAAQTTTAQPAVPTTVALSAPTVAGTLAFTMNLGGDDNDICIVNTDGGGLATLAGGEGYQEYPRWSPDGSRILYQQGVGSEAWAALWVMNADGSGKTQLYDGPIIDAWATWSPDGTQITWTGFTRLDPQHDRAAIFVMNADGSDPHSITSEAGGGMDYWPTWASDGKIYFVRLGEPGVFSRAFRVNPDGSGLEELRTMGNKQIDELAYIVSPDGSKASFQDIATNVDRLIAGPVSGDGNPVILMEPVSGYLQRPQANGSWSPDGKALAIAGIEAFTRLFIVNADGTGLSVVPGIEAAMNPSWRPQ